MDHHSEAIVEVTSSIEYAPSIPCETVAVMYSMGLLYTIAGIATIFFYDPKDEAIRR